MNDSLKMSYCCRPVSDHFTVNLYACCMDNATPGVAMPSIKIGIDLSIDKWIKIGEYDLINIDCIDQSVEIDDTLVSFIDLSRFY